METEKRIDPLAIKTEPEQVTDILNSPESKCLIDYATERINKKKGAIFLFTGEMGNGKSYAGLRYLELWYKDRFDSEFPLNHIVQTLEEAILLVKDFKKIGEGILVEELSVIASARDSLTTANKLWNKFLDTCRIKQAIIIGNLPHISFLDKHCVMTANAWVDCQKIDFKRKIVMCHPLWLQVSPHRNEPYKHRFLDDEYDPIDICYFKLPSKYITDHYNNQKLVYSEDLWSGLADRMLYNRQKQIEKIGFKVLSKQEHKSYILYLKGYSHKEAAKELGLKGESTFSKYLNSAKEKLKSPEFAKCLNEYRKLNYNAKNLPNSDSESHNLTLDGEDFDDDMMVGGEE